MATIDVNEIVKTGLAVLPDIIKFAAILADLIGKRNEAEDLRTIAERITRHSDEQIAALDAAIAEDKEAEAKQWEDAAKAVPVEHIPAKLLDPK